MRFAFGRNWSRFLALVNPERIAEAEESLRRMLARSDLRGVRFLDIGSGSGLFSLAARRLGARVHSFDYDRESVECTAELRRRYFTDDPEWTVEQGSVLDESYMGQLGRFDIVYSWGVLHHTGALWEAVALAADAVAPGGQLCIALYNRQQLWTGYWIAVKKTYNRAPAPARALMHWGYYMFFLSALTAADLARGRNPVARFRGRGRRGMSIYYDVSDWIGGWPFEVASPEEVLNALRSRGFELESLKTCGGKHGCNEFLFRHTSAR